MKRIKVSPNQSAIFRVRSFKRLAAILHCSGEELEKLAASETNYMEYDQDGRWIEAPKPKIKAIHRRFAALLAQIETPDYLHSSVKKRSYVTNARDHVAEQSTAKVDIKKFYRSSRSGQVYSFLTNDLEWSGDVAGLMTRILTHNGHLPTGGNASPLLSFWVYKDLFDAVNEVARESSAVFSLYVDDMTLTGRFVRRKTIHDIRRLVGDVRLKAHKIKYFPPGTSKVITGVAQTKTGPKVPFPRQIRIREAEEALRRAQNNDERFDALKPLVGRLCEAAEIDPVTWRGKRDRAIREKQEIDRARIADTGIPRGISVAATPNIPHAGDEPPWAMPAPRTTSAPAVSETDQDIDVLDPSIANG